jgi:hypothetical protein
MNSMDAQENDPLLLQESVFTNDESKNLDPNNTSQNWSNSTKNRKRAQEQISIDTNHYNSDNRNVVIPYDEFLSSMGNFVCAQCHGMEKVSLERLTQGTATSTNSPCNKCGHNPNYGPTFISTNAGRTNEELILCLQ